MLHWAHILLMGLYFVLPPASLALPLLRRDGAAAGQRAAVGILFGIFVGLGAAAIYGEWLGGVVPVGQTFLLCYWVISLVCLLKLFDWSVYAAVRFCLRVGRGNWHPEARLGIAQALRIAIVFSIGLPYMIVAAVTYRPGVIADVNPRWTQMGATPVTFRAEDGLPLSALWLPATPQQGPAPTGRWGTGTALICPSPGADESSLPVLAQRLHDAGYNVLDIDLRGSGDSGGCIVTFGCKERLDVLGAVRWLRQQNPSASQRIVGIGVAAGSAALLAAAARDRRIDSLVIVAGFDRLQSSSQQIAASFRWPLSWLIDRLGLPLASLQSGCDLLAFSPLNDAIDISPRPILFAYSLSDTLTPFPASQRLFEYASAPKEHLWTHGDEKTALSNPYDLDSMIEFLNRAVPML